MIRKEAFNFRLPGTSTLCQGCSGDTRDFYLDLFGLKENKFRSGPRKPNLQEQLLLDDGDKFILSQYEYNGVDYLVVNGSVWKWNVSDCDENVLLLWQK